MKKIVLVILGLVTVFNCSAIGSAIYWTNPVMEQRDVTIIARHDLAIVDLENLFNNPQELRRLKKVNPGLEILCYVNFFEVWGNPIPEFRPFGTKLANTINSQFPQWLLKDGEGQPVVFYEGMKTLNLSDLCPVISGYTYSRYMAEILLENILDDKVWDGLFLDNLYDEVSWIGQMDLDQDSVVEAKTAVDFAWYRGVDSFLSNIRDAKGKKFLIFGNHLSLFYKDKVDGRMLEEFPTLAHHDWNVVMRMATQWPIVIIQGQGENTAMAFNSSLLVDNAYFCMGNNIPVPEIMLAKINQFKKLSAKQRGKLTYNSDGSYQRRLGDEIITVRP